MKPQFSLIIITTMLIACVSTKKLHITTSAQGINGYVIENQGNRMPMKGIQQKVSKGFTCTVLIFDSTSINETIPHNISNLYEKIQTKQIASVDTDSSGHFSIDLPAGKYSLFIKWGDKYYANLFNQFNQIALFEVIPQQYTEVKLTINRAATF